VRYSLTRGTGWGEKAVGEAVSFPYRLIVNIFSVPLRPTGEEPVLAAAAVPEFDGVPQ